MSNCVGCSGGLGLPEDAIAQHGVQGCDHLAHDSDDDDLGLLARRGEAITEGFESGVVAARTEGGHVEDVTDRHAAAVDAAMSPELAAIEVVWGETDESGDLLAAHAAELWQQGDEGEGEHRADAWHRGQARVTLREIGLGGDHLGQALVEESDIGLDPRQRRRFHRSTALSSSRPFLADAGSGPGNRAGMEETAGAPSSFAALSPRRLGLPVATGAVS